MFGKFQSLCCDFCAAQTPPCQPKRKLKTVARLNGKSAQQPTPSDSLAPPCQWWRGRGEWLEGNYRTTQTVAKQRPISAAGCGTHTPEAKRSAAENPAARSAARKELRRGDEGGAPQCRTFARGACNACIYPLQ